jgi:hypothetical protein
MASTVVVGVDSSDDAMSVATQAGSTCLQSAGLASRPVLILTRDARLSPETGAHGVA